MHHRSHIKSVLVLSAVLASAVFAGGCSGAFRAPVATKAPEVEPLPATLAPEPAPEPAKLVATGDVSLSGNEVNLPGEIQFATGSAKIADTARNKEILAELLQFTKQNANVSKLRIEGHTDNVGKHAKNMKLSTARAASIVAFLAKQGIDKQRLHPVGFASDKPAADHDTRRTAAPRARTRSSRPTTSSASSERLARCAHPVMRAPSDGDASAQWWASKKLPAAARTRGAVVPGASKP